MPPPLHGRKGDVFRSVFPPNSSLQPTPDIESSAPGQPFGGLARFTLSDTQAPLSSVREAVSPPTHFTSQNDQITFDRSWSTVTRYLALPDDCISLPENLPSPPEEFKITLRNVLSPETRLPGATSTDDIVVWYSHQVRYHFMNQVLKVLASVSSQDKRELLHFSIRVLEQAHLLYRHGLQFIAQAVEEFNAGKSKQIVERFQGDFHAIVSSSAPNQLLEAIKAEIVENTHLILLLPMSVGSDLTAAEQARVEFLSLIKGLRAVGLGGYHFQLTFAKVMHDAMSLYVDRTYAGVWETKSTDNVHSSSRRELRLTASELNDDSIFFPRAVSYASPSLCVKELCAWIENTYARLAVEVLNVLGEELVPWFNVDRWKQMSIGRLAALRTRELFDIVGNWPNCGGALDDLRTAVTTPQRRLQLTDVFSVGLEQRLLHPGASTLQILRTYISMIWSFQSLDNSKVLLDRVAHPLHVYLSSREDTVKIIITGLLSDTEDASGKPIEPGGDKLVELAILLNKGSTHPGHRADEDLDWNDMNWTPDPVDAGPGYKRSKSADIIGTLIGVLGSQDVFIKEFQNIVGESLLRHEGNFMKEHKLKDLLITRFGEAPMQACQVMIKDIESSKKVDTVIRRDQGLDPSEEEIAAARAALNIADDETANPEGLFKPSLHAKILSRFFWPQLADGSYTVPSSVARLQERYEQGFEARKSARKLTWLPILGQATVELELQDRVVVEEVHTWQATIIWAFGSDEEGDAVTRNVQELVENLQMDEALVRSGLGFWVGKMVLQEIQKDDYIVLETLNQEDRDKSSAQAAASAGADASADDENLMASKDEMTTEKMAMYWQFILGMLRNSASQMPLQNIATMLKMLIVDGFPYSNEELQEFLGRKVIAGELELVAGKYKLKK